MKNVTKKILGIIGILMLLFTTAELKAQRSSFKSATNYEAYVKLYNNPQVKIARTKAEFANMVKNDERLLAIFDSKTLKTFMSKLKMGENGLITLSYAVIKDKFPKNYVNKVNLVLETFGFAPIDALPVDYTGYYCESKGTCSKSIDSICIGDNC